MYAGNLGGVVVPAVKLFRCDEPYVSWNSDEEFIKQARKEANKNNYPYPINDINTAFAFAAHNSELVRMDYDGKHYYCRDNYIYSVSYGAAVAINEAIPGYANQKSGLEEFAEEISDLVAYAKRRGYTLEIEDVFTNVPVKELKHIHINLLKNDSTIWLQDTGIKDWICFLRICNKKAEYFDKWDMTMEELAKSFEKLDG